MSKLAFRILLLDRQLFKVFTGTNLLLSTFYSVAFLLTWVCKPAYLMSIPSQDKVGGLQQEGPLA